MAKRTGPAKRKNVLVYLELIASKIAEYLPVLKKEQEDTLNPPEKPEGGDNNKSSLPCRKILKFELPDGMDGGTPLGAVKDYLGLGTRIVVCLQNSNIDTAKDLANPGGERQTWSQYFGRTPNFGVKSTNKLYHFMVERGFKPVFVED